MSKGLERLKNKNLPCSNCKELKALEIIKPYIHPYCIAPNDCGGVRIWFTQDGKHYVDIPQEEYDLLKEVML